MTKTWSKNSFGLFNYHTPDLMVKNCFAITERDTKLLRHEQIIELDNNEVRRNRQKTKKILVVLTAQDSEMGCDPDTSTMDLNKKDQETAQLCRIMHQKAKKEEGMSEGYWIYHKNQVDLHSIYTNPEEKLWFVVNKYPNQAFKTKGFKL